MKKKHQTDESTHLGEERKTMLHISNRKAKRQAFLDMSSERDVKIVWDYRKRNNSFNSSEYYKRSICDVYTALTAHINANPHKVNEFLAPVQVLYLH